MKSEESTVFFSLKIGGGGEGEPGNNREKVVDSQCL